MQEIQKNRKMPATTGQMFSEKRLDLTLFELLRIVLRGKWIFVLSLIFCAGFAIFYIEQIAASRYRATVQMALKPQGQVVNLDSVISGVSADETSINTELGILRSRSLMEQVVRDLDLTQDPEFNIYLAERSPYSLGQFYRTVSDLLTGKVAGPIEISEEDALWITTSTAQSQLTVSAERRTYLYSLQMTSISSQKSALIANRLAEVYLEDQVQQKFAATQYAVNWLSEKVAELELAINEKEGDINALRSDSNLISAEALDALNIRSVEIRTRIEETRRKNEQVEDRIRFLSQLRSVTNLDDIARQLDDPLLNRLAQNGIEDSERASFGTRLDAIRATARQELDRNKDQISALMESLRRVETDQARQNKDLTQMNILQREAQATRVLYETFLTRLKETSIQMGLQQPDSRILSIALPGRKIAPRPKVIMFAAVVLGFLIGLSIILFREFRASGFRTAEEIEDATGIQVLAQIPRVQVKSRKALLSYITNNPASVMVEAVRNLRTSIMMTDIGQQPQVIMMTSSVPGEGKTTLSLALAQSYSGMQKRVLLIEGDIRRRTFSQYIDADANVGLLTAMTNPEAVSECLVRHPELGFDILMGQNTSMSATDLFASAEFGNLLTICREKFDVIVIDMPPVLAVPDSRVAAQYVDAIIYTIYWDSTQYAQVLNGLKEFRSVGRKVDGIVLNRVDSRRMKSYGYSSGYYNNYGSG